MPSSADPFEQGLEAMFANPPEAPDAEDFVLSLERRLAAEERRRRLVYGVCTAAAGLGAAAVFAISGFLGGSTRALSATALAASEMDFSWSWVAQTAPILGVAVVIWILAELSPSMQDR